jgi:hypothetical protein
VFSGFCLIINNREFYKDSSRRDAKQMINREGTDVDKGKSLFRPKTSVSDRITK